MQKEFEMSMLGELSFLLGLKISELKYDVFISHTRYVKEMLKRFNMEDCKLVCTPTVTRWKLRKEDEAKEAYQNIYISMIGSMLYVASSRTYIIQVVGLVTRFQETPKETHI